MDDFCDIVNHSLFSETGRFESGNLAKYKEEFEDLDVRITKLGDVCRFLASRDLAVPIDPVKHDSLKDLRAESNRIRDILGTDDETLGILLHFVGASSEATLTFTLHYITLA